MYAFSLSAKAESSVRFEVKDSNCSTYASFLFCQRILKPKSAKGGHLVFQFLDTVDIYHSIIFSVIQGYQWIAYVVF